ncbi:unnamed protein product, partial [marine sediment metagenome]
FRRRVFLSNYQEDALQAHRDWAALEGVPRTLVLPSSCHLLHYAYPSIDKYMCKTLGMYARIEAQQYSGQGRRFSLVRLIGEPAKAFVRRFFVRQGFRDGLRGFILCVLFAGYRFATWANLWLLEELERQRRTNDDPESQA